MRERTIFLAAGCAAVLIVVVSNLTGF